MGSKNDQRRSKRRQKQKKSRTEAQQSRKARQRVGKATPSRSASWPLGDCWISENWHEPGAEIHAIFSRVHADGTAAGVVLHADLSERGLISVDNHVGVPEGVITNKVVELADSATFIATDAAQVVRLVEDALGVGRANGHTQPTKRLAEAREIFGDVDADDAPYDFALPEDVSDEETDEIPSSKGFTHRLKQLFGG